MKEENEFIDFYSGTEVSIIGLRRQLKCIGDFGIIQDNFNSGNLAGFYEERLIRFGLKYVQ